MTPPEDTEAPTRRGKYLQRSPGDCEALEPRPGIERCVHLFDWPSIVAVDAAMATGRPLLVRGRPGTGKSQLAEAAATAMGRVFISTTVDGRTDPRDLKWSTDAVRRLADAQVLGARGVKNAAQVEVELNPEKYLRPGPLWWAFDWDGAWKLDKDGHCVRDPEADTSNGIVLLVDELDKADPSVPNSLLDALGRGCFDVPDHGRVTRTDPEGAPLLVVVTTNEERSLPDAFLRRCLVLQLALPADRSELIAFLVARGAGHFPEADPKVLEDAAGLLADDRKAILDSGLSPPGLAEYLDLIRAFDDLQGSHEDNAKLLELLGRFTFNKHPPEEIR